MKVGYLILCVVALISIFQWIFYAGNLPPRVAGHFGANGQPDGFTDRGQFVAMMIVLNFGLPTFLALTAKLLWRLPTSMLNVPNKEYWLSEERRDASLHQVESMLIWIAVGTQAFMIAIGHFVYMANRDGTGLSQLGFLTSMGLFLLFVGGICAAMFYRFRMPATT